MSQRWHRLRHPQRGLETPAWYTVKKCVSRFQSLKALLCCHWTHWINSLKAGQTESSLPISWDPWKLDMFLSATISQEPRFDELGSQQHPQLFFLQLMGFPFPVFGGSRLVTLWECHPATENRQHLLVIKYVYQLPCDLGLGNPLFLFVFWCRMGVLVASRTGTRATLILQAWHGVRVGVWVLGWALKLEWSACHASRHSVERLAFPGVADMPSI